VRYIDPCWPKIAKLESDSIYCEVPANITEILEGILVLDISPSRVEHRLGSSEDMVDSLWRDTPEWESRDDHIDGILTDDLIDMSSTHRIYLALRSEFFSQYINLALIHLDDDESRIRCLAREYLSRHSPIPCSEFDDHMSIPDICE
jgi:hypothetical protein